jgi:uncharacterized protein (TIGR00251 family)
VREGMETEALIRVKVTPRSSKNRIAGKEKDFYRVKVTSAPVKGKANDALIDLLAEELDVPKRRIEIVSGRNARLKSVRVCGLSPEAVALLLDKSTLIP